MTDEKVGSELGFTLQTILLCNPTPVYFDHLSTLITARIQQDQSTTLYNCALAYWFVSSMITVTEIINSWYYAVLPT